MSIYTVQKYFERKNIKKALFKLLLPLLIFSCIAQVQAADASSPQKQLQWSVDSFIGRLVRELPAIKKDANRFNTVFDATLGKMVDFERISENIMGSHVSAAPPGFAKELGVKLKQQLMTEVGNFFHEFDIQGGNTADTQAFLRTFEMKFLTDSNPVAGQENASTASAAPPSASSQTKVRLLTKIPKLDILLTFHLYKNAELGWQIENIELSVEEVSKAFKLQFDAAKVVGIYFNELFKESKKKYKRLIDRWDITQVLPQLLKYMGFEDLDFSR